MRRIFIDGSGASLEGQIARICVITYGAHDNPVSTLLQEIGRATSNEAEYLALIAALKDPNSEGCHIYTDSMLLVGQLTKNWNVKADNLKPLYKEAYGLLNERKAVLSWMPRHANTAGKLLEKGVKSVQILR